MSDRMAKIIAAGEAEHEAVRKHERKAIAQWLYCSFVNRDADDFAVALYIAEAITRGDHLEDATHD